MFETLSRRLLRLLLVPPEPEPPFGAPGSLRVFRAGHNLFRLRLWLWAVKQVLALGAFVFWVFFIVQIERAGHHDGAQVPDGTDHWQGWYSPHSVREWMGELADHTPGAVFTLLWTLKGIGLVAYLAQLPITYALRRLDYEQRWYVVTDRSLRLRTGVWSVREMTMSFANLQQITVTQGPLQRLLGLADVRVQSAGGGSGHGHQQQAQPSLHTGLFQAVDNAEEIRDLITERLRRFRETGLGDPDEKRHAVPAVAQATTDSAALAAAKELLAEARALRASLTRTA